MTTHMFFYYNDEYTEILLGPVQIRLTETAEEYEQATTWRDVVLSLGDYQGEIPSCTLVEEYIRGADIYGAGDKGNDFIFVNAWSASRTRKEALIAKYGSLENAGIYIEVEEKKVPEKKINVDNKNVIEF